MSWRGIAAATAVHYAVGALWFSDPVFGRRWARAIGFDAPQGYRPPLRALLGPLAGSLLGATATAVLAERTGARSWTEGMSLGTLVGLGYGAGMSITYAVAPETPRPAELAAITGGYQLAGFALAGATVTAVR